MRVAIVLVLGIAVVSAIDTRMCMRNCRMNDHYCRWTGAPGETEHFCMQKKNECFVGCVKNCKSACGRAFTTDKCVSECQYRGMMMLDMGMKFEGKQCMEQCMWNANQCNQRCEDVFFRNGLDKPMMEYIYPEMEAEDWTVNTGVMENPNREAPPQFNRGLMYGRR